jgi:hypothetical protein
MFTRIIPQARGKLIVFGTSGLSGALKIGNEVGLVHNSAARIATDLYDLTGTPGAPTNTGKQARLNQARVDVTTAEHKRRAAVAASVKFCADAVDVLKPHLGRRWNARWRAAGFSMPSLELPRHPLSPLLELRDYLRDHPAHENPVTGTSAAAADMLATLLKDVDHTLNSAAEGGEKSPRRRHD